MDFGMCRMSQIWGKGWKGRNEDLQLLTKHEISKAEAPQGFIWFCWMNLYKWHSRAYMICTYRKDPNSIERQ
jgi:hypothetical protein